MKDFTNRQPGSKATAVAHIYQRARGGFQLFYTDVDFLVFFSVFCVFARKHNIRVFGLCPMFDHLHTAVEAIDRSSVSPFVRDASSYYARVMNTWTRTDCPFCFDRFGCAIKHGDKKIRTTFSYVYNNPGEKGLCAKAEDYRWTFLAYAVSNNPFSEPLRLRLASMPLRRALKMIDYHVQKQLPLQHEWLTGVLDSLSSVEREQFIDYAIVSYNVIDYDGLLSYYGSYEKACLAFASNQGSEYDIKEEYSTDTHKGLIDIKCTLERIGKYHNVTDVIKTPLENRNAIARLLYYDCRATPNQIRKYLRLY